MSYKLIYLLGSGNSGSTLVAKSIASVIDATNLGEVSNLQNWVVRNEYCGCGELITECSFWNPILSDISFAQKRFVTTSCHPSLQLKGIVSLLEIYKYAAQLTDKSFVIDASKNAKAFRLLWQYGNLPILPIYIIRSPFDYIQSASKRGINPLRAIYKWLILNLRTLYAIHQSRSKRFVQLIDFRHFVTYPHHELQRVLSEHVPLDQEIVLLPDHSIAGTRTKASMTHINSGILASNKPKLHHFLLVYLSGAHFLYKYVTSNF